MVSDRLPAPRRGEWRSVVRECDQSFEAYVRDCANRKSATRSRLILLPLGDLASRFGPTLSLLRDYGSIFFGLDAQLGDAQAITDAAQVPQRSQYNSSMILDDLAERLDNQALITLAITDVDLFSRGTRYVFGEGTLERRVGICSLARLATPDESLFRRRALRLMSHEAGHILSLSHCVRRRCLMQGANTLEESDHQPLQPCAEDLRKLHWNTGVDLCRRADGLRDFYARLGWTGESGIVRADLG
ncbi:MAG TPA: archaemetzincin [Planctomycetota bacterium]|nr:archaemetzincin [Planctomycetota bacterium]